MAEGVMIMLPRISKRLCNQSIVLHIANGEEDDYGKQKTVDMPVNNVLVQPDNHSKCDCLFICANVGSVAPDYTRLDREPPYF